MGSVSHRVFSLFGIVLLIGISVTAVRPQGAAIEGVQIVNGRNGVGPAQDIPVGSFQVDGKTLSPGDGKETNVSVTVSKGYFVKFCAEKTGGGKCEEYGEGTHNLLSADFNFIMVWKGAPGPATAATGSAVAAASSPAQVSAPAAASAPSVIAFEQKNWGGRSQVFGPGMYRSYRGEFGKINDNQVRAVVITKGFRARFCSEEGIYFRGSGDCEIHEEGKYNLRFANSISFIEVTDLADTSPDQEKMPVVLYEDVSQGGKMQGFDVGAFLASQGQFRKLGNDHASSITVKDGYRASVCADEPAAAGGDGVNCEQFGPGKKNLKNKKVASYIKVSKE